MKQISKIAFLALGGLLISAVSPAYADDNAAGEWVAQKLNAAPLAFTRNMGQWDEPALFRAEAGLATVWITTEGVHYQFTRRLGGIPAGEQPTTPDQVETIALKAALVGANPLPVVSGHDPMNYTCNYFIGRDMTKWRTDVPNFRAVVLEEVYPGIDLLYYGNGGRMEYDFRVSAGADYSRILIRYEGAGGLTVAADGALVITTPWGEIRELAPVVYQESRGMRRPVTARYELKENNAFGFQLGPELDVSLPVVIDPILVYSAYVGGSKNDASRAIAVDASGSAYITGESFSADFPTRNSYQTSQEGYFNAFVTKVSGAGNALLYSTYFGGSVTDAGNAVAVDQTGAVYVTGFASSGDFPTLNAYQPDFGGGTADAFVVKLSSAGNSLVYSTFLGGANWDNGHGIAVDGSGAAYVTGYTTSTDFPIYHAYQDANSGDFDVFVTKLSSQGTSLVYSTYLGGGGADDANAIKVDASGRAHLTGRTASSDFPTANPYQTDQPGVDVFFTKFASNGNNLVLSTYLGGSGDDYGHGIAVAADGDIYLSGRTWSPDFPTLNAYQSTNAGAYDAFVTRFSSVGGLIYSTYLGGTADDYCYALAVDAAGSAFVTGRAYSTDFPTFEAYQATFQGGSADAFVSKLSSTGSTLMFSSYLGGTTFDGGYGIAVDASGAAYVTGYTDSDDFPTLSICQASFPEGGADGFVAKFAELLGPDLDGDGVTDAVDNCPDISNPCQEDNNGDGTGNACCCVGRVGDPNAQGEFPDEVTLGDIMLLVDVKFVSGDCNKIACISEADVNQDGGANPACEDHVTLGDIMVLVDFLFIASPETATLPDCL
jgi:hypothetical protein